MYSLCRTTDNHVEKCFTSETTLSAVVFIPSDMVRYIDGSAIPHQHTPYRVSGERITVNTLERSDGYNSFHVLGSVCLVNVA